MRRKDKQIPTGEKAMGNGGLHRRLSPSNLRSAAQARLASVVCEQMMSAGESGHVVPGTAYVILAVLGRDAKPCKDDSFDQASSKVKVKNSSSRNNCIPASSILTMAFRPAWRSLHWCAKRRINIPQTPYRCFSCSVQLQAGGTTPGQDKTTHFGFETIPETEKESRGTYTQCFFLCGATGVAC